MSRRKKLEAYEVVSYSIFSIIGVMVFIFMLGVMIYCGQQLLWQLRRADCGSYTISQQATGDIPIQCKEGK